jgi:plasmid stabilization system protein ParE
MTPTSDGLPSKHGYLAANPLVEEAEHATELLRHNPELGVRLRRARDRWPEIRRLLLQTGWHLYYSVDVSRSHVLILAVWYASRGGPPPLWRAREAACNSTRTDSPREIVVGVRQCLTRAPLDLAGPSCVHEAIDDLAFALLPAPTSKDLLERVDAGQDPRSRSADVGARDPDSRPDGRRSGQRPLLVQ